MSQFGIPYMGSKSKYAEEISKIFPKANNFYDLFGGGFSITHAMLVNRKNDFKEFHFNEIRNGMTDLIKDSISGKYSYENFKMPWVSREEFFRTKEENLFNKIIWSFGNKGDSYIFGKEIENQKESLHNAIIFNKFDSFATEFFGFSKFREGYSIYNKRVFIKRRLEHFNKSKSIDMQQLEQLERLERLEQLERLQQLEQLYFYNLDYKKVPIKENSIIYCDIPYESTGEYDSNDSFSHKEFYEWVYENKNPVFVSEYSINKPFLKLIWFKKTRSTLSPTNNACEKVEKVYCNNVAFEMIREQKLVST